MATAGTGAWRKPGSTALAALLALASGAPASAGAWLQPEGRGQIIFNPSLLVAKQRFDRQGRSRAMDRFIKQDSQTLIEYGWRKDLTLLMTAGQRMESFPWQGEAQRVSTSSLGGGAQAELFRQDSFILSAAFTGSYHLERSLPAADRRFGPRLEADARLLAGYSFAVAGMSGFAEGQIGYRWRSGRASDELRADMTLGLRPLPRLLLLFQALNALFVQGDRSTGDGRMRQHKLQVSAVVDLTDTWSLQGGAFLSIAGRNALKERGLVFGVWRKF